MKSTTLFLFITISAIHLRAQHQLTVKVADLKKVEGAVEVCLFDSHQNYMKDAVKCTWVSVESENIELTFDSLSAGQYAVVVIQDLNGNKNLDTNFMGIPKEPYGFSNNPSTTFGPPSFEGAKFNLDESTAIEIKLK